MENMKVCQSCAMPLEKAEDYGTNKDNSTNQDYCIYCFKEGEFTSDITMEQMIDYCTNEYELWQIPMTKEAYIRDMQETFPKLKRWAKI